MAEYKCSLCDDEENFKICETCNISYCFKHNMIALCWCQSMDCYCRKCIMSRDVICEECNTNFNNELVDSTKVVVEDCECLCKNCKKSGCI